MGPWELAERLDAAADADETWTIGVTALAALGVAGAIWIDAASPGPPRMRSTLAPGWQAENARALSAGADPFPRFCLSRLAPVRTGAAYLDRYPYLSDAQRRLVRAAAAETGFTAGTSLTVRAAPDGRGQGWNLLADGGADALETLLGERGPALATAAHLVHARLAAPGEDASAEPAPTRGRADPSAPTGLSPRESACLAFVADGLRVAELAHRIGLSEATVEFHLANARRRLGARTRDHAVALALRAGLL